MRSVPSTPAFSKVARCSSPQSCARRASPSAPRSISLDTQLTSAGQNTQLATPWYSDQVLPFDVTLSGANEYGAMCAAKIFGLEILNEGMGISIDDAVTEMQAEPGVSVLPYTKTFAHARQAQAPFGIRISTQDQAPYSGSALAFCRLFRSPLDTGSDSHNLLRPSKSPQ